MKIRNYWALTAALAVVPMLAVAEQGKIYLTPAVGGIKYDSDVNLDSSTLFQLGGEVMLTDRIGAELGYSTTEADVHRGTGEVDLDQLFLNGYFYFGRMGVENRWEPYVSLGVAHASFDPSTGSTSDETFGSAGIGTRFHFTDRISARLDARALNSLDNEETHAQYTLGLSYAFGGKKPEPAPVAAPAPAPAPVDSDGDGVYDDKDRCPNTPRGREVDEFGCEYVLKKTEEMRLEVEFGFDSAEVRDESMPEIERAAKFLRRYANVKSRIEGHTDSVGTDAYNQKLSERRADAVRAVLVERFGIDASRLTSVGYGESRPIADNDTDAGRAQNRRVVAVMQAEVTE